MFFVQGVIVDTHGQIIGNLNYDPNWEGPVYNGENQILGPGFAPFKPYLRPKYFISRVSDVSVVQSLFYQISVSDVCIFDLYYFHNRFNEYTPSGSTK